MKIRVKNQNKGELLLNLFLREGVYKTLQTRQLAEGMTPPLYKRIFLCGIYFIQFNLHFKCMFPECQRKYKQRILNFI